MNYIDQIRNNIHPYFNPNASIPGSEETIFSPDGAYRVETKAFRLDNPPANWEVLRVEVFEVKSSRLLQSFLINDVSNFFHSWVTKDKISYLLCGEDLCGGQTVIDLTNNKMASYSANDDGFIWTKHLLSPDGNLLAVFGCGWGSPFFPIIYHFDNPMDLPLKIAYEPDWTGHDIIEWVDNKSIRVQHTDASETSILEL